MLMEAEVRGPMQAISRQAQEMETVLPTAVAMVEQLLGDMADPDRLLQASY